MPHAIVLNPNQSQVNQALQRGIDFAQQHRPPNELYAHFGATNKFEPHGFLVTKTSGLAVMSSHYALRGEKPSVQDIQRILNEDTLQVIVNVYGDSSDFARDSYLIIKQDQQIVKPHRIRFDARARQVSHDYRGPVYQAKIVALFPYGSFNPTILTTLLVYPGIGGEIQFTLDLLKIP